MKQSFRDNAVRLFCLTVVVLASTFSQAADWTIPMAGNTFRTAPEAGGNGVRRNGPVAWSDPSEVFSVYFHLDRTAELNLQIKAATSKGRSTIETHVGQHKFKTAIEATESVIQTIGKAVVTPAGYVRVDFQGVERTGDVFAEIDELLVSSDTEGLQVDFVRNNEGNMFYWGRRGPSVHLSYQVPKDVSLEYAYSEVTVPKGQDPIGTFYMATGFGQGYFGFQVNGPKERRVLFSVWSPFKTDNPRDIPKEQRIIALARGVKVHIGEFGNEGSGGQSYLVYPWKAGRTYCFLTKVEPDGKGNTVYTSWFGDKAEDSWQLIACFRRPQTDTHLRGFHSFLESFSPAYGFIGRRAFYGNVWVCDVSGEWHECTKARFSVDGTGRGRHRLDYSGGVDGKNFFLRNCGFFNETGNPGEVFSRTATGTSEPDINLESLPMK